MHWAAKIELASVVFPQRNDLVRADGLEFLSLADVEHGTRRDRRQTYVFLGSAVTGGVGGGGVNAGIGTLATYAVDGVWLVVEVVGPAPACQPSFDASDVGDSTARCSGLFFVLASAYTECLSCASIVALNCCTASD